MAETVSNVYDLIYPSPITLKEISSIVVAVNLWRQEIEKYCKTCTPTSESVELIQNIALKSVIPKAPLAIYDVIEEHTARFRISIAQWLGYHFHDVFYFHHKNWNNLIKDFNDFAYDWNGAIHYVRTAKRMMFCDRFNDEEKFMIACKYCFEEDIERIWPSVSTKMDLNEIDSGRFPLLCYWICRFKNELHKITNNGDESVDEVMLYKCRDHDWSSVLYFWNRIPSDRQSQTMVKFSTNNWESFTRFILPKLNEHQFDEFVAGATTGGLISVLLNHDNDKDYLLPTWMYIRNKMDENNFNRVIEEMFYLETNHFKPNEKLGPKDDAYVCREFWKSAPNNLKKSAIKNVLLNGELFGRQCIRPSEPREMRFLITVLLDASIEERKSFCHKNWSDLVDDARIEDLRGIMKLCFENESEISRFMETTATKYENISEYCVALLKRGHNKELNNFLLFCFPNTQTRREFKKRLLQSNFLGEDSILSVGFWWQANEMNEFIDDAFNSVDLARDFKNKLMSCSVTEKYLFECIRLGYFVKLVEFVDTFVLEEQDKDTLKKRLFDHFKNNLIAGTIWRIEADELQKISVWFLGSEDEVVKFKESISVDDIFRNMVENELRSCEAGVIRYPLKFDEFLLWYFASSEKVEEFKKRFSNELKRFSPRR